MAIYQGEQEQVEALENWWRESAWAVIGWVVLGLGAAFAVRPRSVSGITVDQPSAVPKPVVAGLACGDRHGADGRRAGAAQAVPGIGMLARHPVSDHHRVACGAIVHSNRRPRHGRHHTCCRREGLR